MPSSAPRPRWRRWPALAAMLGGTVLLVGAGLWRACAVPALVKFPTAVDQRPRYEGTFTLFVDPESAAPLPTPRVLELSVDRHVEALPEESDADRVVVRETIAYEVAGLAAAAQIHQYVIDRRTNANVRDKRAWAFDEGNHLDRRDAYWVAMPKQVGDGSTVSMYKDEIGTTFTAVGGPDTQTVNGLDLVGVSASGTAQPLTDAYLRSLDAVVPLPRSLGFDRLKPALAAAGLPVDEAVFRLAGLASPEDLSALGEIIAEPIPLQYVVTFSGETFVDPRTGAIVAVTSVVERVGARPDPDALPALLSILQRYGDDPTIAAVVDGLDQLATQPLPVFEYRYRQVPASVEEVAAWVADQHGRIDLAERSIPLGLVTAAAIAVMTGAFVRSRRRRALVDHPRKG